MSEMFLSPWWLTVVPFIGTALFFIYRNKGTQQQHRVSSIKLLAEFQKAPHAKALPFVPLRFLLELLFALLIAVGLARLTTSTEAKHILIVADTSLSTYRNAPNGRPVVEFLKSNLSDYLSNFPEEQIFTLMIANGSVAEPDITATDILARIEHLKTPYADTLGNLLAEVDFHQFDEVFLMTDHEIKGADASKFIIPKLPQLSSNNLFLHSIVTRINSGKTTIQGNIGRSVGYNYSDASVQIIVKNEQEKPLSSVNVSLLNDDNPFKITVSESNGYVVEIKSSSLLQDGIPNDSKMFVDGSNNVNQQILVVNADPKKINVPAFGALQYLTPEEINSSKHTPEGTIFFSTDQSEDTLSSPGEILSHQFNKAAAQTAPITEWNSDSPLLTYISFDRERLFSYSPLECPPWMTIDLKVGQSSVLCHGSNFGKRIVYSGIKLFPFDEKQATVGNIIALNTLKWLFGHEGDKQNVLLDESKLQPAPLEITVASKAIHKKSALEKTSVPYKWFTVILVLLLLVDSLWWIKSKRVFGR